MATAFRPARSSRVVPVVLFTKNLRVRLARAHMEMVVGVLGTLNPKPLLGGLGLLKTYDYALKFPLSSS